MRDIAERFSDLEIPEDGISRLLEELACHEKTLVEAFRFRRAWGPNLKKPESEDYFDEKLSGLISVTRMAFLEKERTVSAEEIPKYVDHYSHLVAKLVAADWRSRSRRPTTDRSVRDSSYLYRDELKRLVER